MGKLVLHLADGTTLDVRLSRERITIGRRADNDVCLPYPAVSGEHAAVVTILADSFLEDLGSTNGTLVNGKPIAKHFLRDRDEIDIGRQRLVYLADESATLEPGPGTVSRSEAKLFGGRALPARAPTSVAVPEAGPGADAGAATVESDGATPDIARFVAAELRSDRAESAERVVGTPDPPPPAASDPRAPVAALRVLTGPSAGREVVLDTDETTIGRVGVQVAALRRADGGYRLVPLEGSSPPSVNGAPVPAEGRPLSAGNTLEIAGTRLELVERPSGRSEPPGGTPPFDRAE